MIISIDGPAGSGKSTVAQLIAENLGFIHFNSGSLYRAITAYLLETNFNIEEITVNSQIPKLKLKTIMEQGVQHVYVNNVDFTDKLRLNEVSVLTPIVSTNKKIRKIIDDCQREFAKNHNIVVDGRDIGSFVFPDAEFKFYLDCDIHERAKRRFKEEKAKHTHITLKEIEEQIAKRDEIDKTKEIAPLVVPNNAIIIDSTDKSIDQVAKAIIDNIKI